MYSITYDVYTKPSAAASVKKTCRTAIVRRIRIDVNYGKSRRKKKNDKKKSSPRHNVRARNDVCGAFLDGPSNLERRVLLRFRSRSYLPTERYIVRPTRLYRHARTITWTRRCAFYDVFVCRVIVTVAIIIGREQSIQYFRRVTCVRSPNRLTIFYARRTYTHIICVRVVVVVVGMNTSNRIRDTAFTHTRE